MNVLYKYRENSSALTEMVSPNCIFILVCWHSPLTGSEGTKEGPETGNQDRTEVKSLTYIDSGLTTKYTFYTKYEYGGFYTMRSDSFCWQL
jgi:hypothetical protein